MSNEVNRILKLLLDLQHGDSWIGTNFKEAYHGVNAKIAAGYIQPGTNSIWGLTAHIIYWRSIVVKRLSGSNDLIPYPDFHLPKEMTPEKWKQTMIDFEATYHRLKNSIHLLKDEQLDLPSPKEGQTYYQLIQGCLQHDAYHLGQIVLIKKILSSQPV